MGNATIRQSAYDFVFYFNRNYVSILYRFRDIASYLSKVADFDSPHLHLAPSYQKTRVPRLLCGFVCVIPRLAILDSPETCS